jgi:hypothetical protein
VLAAVVEEQEQKQARERVTECEIQASAVQFNCRGEYECATSYGIIINLILFN